VTHFSFDFRNLFSKAIKIYHENWQENQLGFTGIYFKGLNRLNIFMLTVNK